MARGTWPLKLRQPHNFQHHLLRKKPKLPQQKFIDRSTSNKNMGTTDPIHDATEPVNRRGHAILAICIVCGVVESVAVALRFLARRKLKARLQVDDWFIFASLWPNYAMIITGGFCKSSFANFARPSSC